MSVYFPGTFRLEELSGPRGRSFSSRADAFQQLIGEALKRTAGPCANVDISRTKGADGSIDVFLGEGCNLTGPFADLPLPMIVECKDHDDSLNGIADNVRNGWYTLKNTLAAKAKNGWSGDSAPWKSACSYVYCVSAALPKPATRQTLENGISEFVKSPQQKLSIQIVKVLDWNDIRLWLDDLPTLADAWLGTHLEFIIAHEDYVARLHGFRGYLKDSELQFVPPPDDDPRHPRRIFERLSENLESPEKQPGLIIVGPGGVGKTRTALEVSTLAVAHGCRVLHVEPGEVTWDDIAAVVCRHTAKTILIFDYLDLMLPTLNNLDHFRRNLLPQAARRGINVGLLATSRPRWMDLPNRNLLDELFQPVFLKPTAAQRAAITRVMVKTVAATACCDLGEDFVTRICGERPIIALLIALELEKRATQNQLADLDLSDIRRGDLGAWLRRRLKEDDLYVKSSTPSLLPSQPDPSLVAAAAAMACAPDSREVLTTAARSALEYLGWPNPEHADFLVSCLQKLGWLEAFPYGESLSTPHDVVADEVLDQVVQEGAYVRNRELAAVLAVTSQIPHSIGQLAIAFARVIGAIESQDIAQSLEVAAGQWLRGRATELGVLLVKPPIQQTGHALGTVLAGPPWSDVAIEVWDSLIGPWLSAHGHEEEARYLLYPGLKFVRPNRSPALLIAALNWLSTHATRLSATFVLGPLLRREDLGDNEPQKAITYALSWLCRYAVAQSQYFDASFVLSPLLGRQELTEEQAKTAIDHAFSWLREYGTDADPRFDASFVLGPLLGRQELTKEQAKTAIEHAFSWLRKYYNDLDPCLDASFVLCPLLFMEQVPEDSWREFSAREIRWCKKYWSASSLETKATVLYSLFRRPELLDSVNLEAVVLWAADCLSNCTSREVGETLDKSLRKGLRKLEQTLGTDNQLVLNIAQSLNTSRWASEFDVLLDQLRRCAEDRKFMPDISFIESACSATEEMSRKKPGVAALAVRDLLILSSRVGHNALRIVKGAIAPILCKLSSRQRNKAGEACCNAMNRDLFSSRDQARELLQELKLHD